MYFLSGYTSGTSNTIKTVYNNGAFLLGNTAVSSTVQVGLRGSSNSDFNNRLNTSSSEFVNSTPGTLNTSTQSFNSSSAVPGMLSCWLDLYLDSSILLYSVRIIGRSNNSQYYCHILECFIFCSGNI
jgi:hypothetical protein